MAIPKPFPPTIMNKTNSPQDEVKNIFLTFCETSSQDGPVTDEVLRQEGIDPQAAEQKGNELFRKYQLSRQFAHKVRQNKSAFEQAKQFVKEQGAKALGAIPNGNDRREALQTILCRDFNELSDQEVNSILNDQTILDLLDNMDESHRDPTKGTSNSRP